MKKTKLITLLLLILVITATSANLFTNGLIGEWSLDGNASDQTGNNHNGIVYGATSTIDRDNNANGAYNFDGADDYIEISDHSNFDLTGNFTISVWINANSGGEGNYGRIVSKFGGTYDGWDFFIGDSSNKKLGLKINNVNLWSEDGTITKNEWHMVTVVFEVGTGVTFYVDDIAAGFTDAYTLAVIANDYNVRLGSWPYGTDRTFDGAIDDVRIYNQALSPQEIADLFNPNNGTGSCAAIYCDGDNVGIGTATTHGHKLAVAGSILTESVKVKAATNWPDYVFENDYDLQSLEKFEQYIITQKHLPGMPSASKIQKDGYELADMDKRLLKNIEELSLHLIQLNKTIQNQADRIKELETKLGKSAN